MKELAKNKVVLGLSGGVDSTTAALLLKEKGFEVVGLFFDALGDNYKGRQIAEKAALQLGIQFIYKDVSKEFKQCVIENFCTEYINGRTPNPCVMCNPNIKFKCLLNAANDVGAYYVATGHYAKIAKIDDKYYIKRASSEKKDQSYMLCRLGQDVLSRLIFPLSEIQNKDETRDLARAYKLDNAEASDSQEICFIDEKTTNYVDFIRNHGYTVNEGNFIDKSGNVLGKHKGLINYTVGQRKGLGITFGKPMFVLSLNKNDNTVTLGDNEDLFTNDVISEDNFFTETGSSKLPLKYKGKVEINGKVRYAAKLADAVLYQGEDGITKTVFQEPQRAATPGQTIVFYVNDLVIGSGYIK